MIEITRTIHADKRYYLDEDSLVNGEALLQSMEYFNDCKMDLYNRLYEKHFLKSGILTEGTKYTEYLKSRYGTNDYYNAALYTAAAGQISSQRELQALYRQTVAADIKNRQAKIASAREELYKNQQIKDSIRNYAKTGRWVKPYPKCTLKVTGFRISGYGLKDIPIDEYERRIERGLRNLKHRIAMLEAGLARKEQKLETLNQKPPKRIVFGSRKQYAGKDQMDADIVQWKTAFHFRRHSSMSLPGRHTSKHGNFLCKFEDGNLSVTNMDSSITVFHEFHLSRYHQEFLNNFTSSVKERRALCYSFTLHKDRNGRLYVVPSVTMTLSREEDCWLNAGCISMDVNWDHLALSDIGPDGKLLGTTVIPLPLEGKTSGQNAEIIGQAVKKVFEFCVKKHKAFVMEDIDLTIKKHAAKYSSRTGNRHLNLTSYQKIKSCIMNQSLKTGIPVSQVDPAYTSQAGKFLFMRRFGISIHCAASYAIGLKALGYKDLLMPDAQVLSLIPLKAGDDWFRKIWASVTIAFKDVRTHTFYWDIPYYVLETAKKPTLRSLALEMNRLAGQT